MKKTAIIILSLFLVITLMPAQSEWKLDKAHSGITFSVRHMVISTVTGVFKDYSIILKTNKDNYSDASVAGTIIVASINTESEQRDNHLKSDDFFNAEKYPEITFKSISFDKVSDGKYKIIGDLTIRDITKTVTFDAIYNGSAKTPWGATMSSWSATTVINRFDYNLKWNKTIETGGLIVGQDVTITLNLEFTK